MEEQSTKPIVIENLFSDSDIESIWSSPNPGSSMFDLFEKHYRRLGQIDIDNNIIQAYSEFHLNNLIFLKENFQLTTEVTCKLLNIFNLLLSLKTGTKDKTEPNFALIGKNKLQEVKQGLIQTGLIAKESATQGFYLHRSEIAKLLDYINSFYIPFIRLYYHFANIENITENKRIELIINRPLPVPLLNVAVQQINEKNQIEVEIEDEEDQPIDVSMFDKPLGW
jgi:hypothetical protein